MINFKHHQEQSKSRGWILIDVYQLLLDPRFQQAEDLLSYILGVSWHFWTFGQGYLIFEGSLKTIPRHHQLWWRTWTICIFQVQLRFCNMNREGCVEMLQLGVLHVGMQPQVGRHAAQGSTLNLLLLEGRAKKGLLCGTGRIIPPFCTQNKQVYW